MINENHENIPNIEELNEEFIRKKEDKNNNNTSLNKFYICGLILIIFVMTFKINNKDKLKEELKEELKKELEESISNQLENNFNKLEKNLQQNIFQTEKNLEINFLNNLKKYLNITENMNTKVCLCAIGKKENKYAKEFVNYYKKLGYNHIFIYDNNDVNDEKFEDVLGEEIAQNFVTVIDYRGYRGKRDKPQLDAYFDCYEKNSGIYDWLSFYDFDEFLFLKDNKNIQEFLNEEKFKNCINIKINWMVYSDNDLIYYENKPVQERFTTPLPKDSENKHIKSTCRGHLKENFWKNMVNPHTSNNDYLNCIPTGEKTDPKSPFYTPPNYEYAYIKHYITKTIEEFISKIKKGRADFTIKSMDEKYLRGRLDYFFQRNKKTKEKLDYIKKELNIDIH